MHNDNPGGEIFAERFRQMEEENALANEAESRLRVRDRAILAWHSWTENERYGVRFGLFPHERMQEIEREGYDSHAITLALMTIAEERR